MGNVNTFLKAEDYKLLEEETGFTESQIRRLYSRFANLDKRSKGYLERQDLMLIPELAVNPLGSRIIEAFFTNERCPTEPLDTINFKQFVRVLATFRSIKGHEHALNTRDKKMEFIFRVYDSDRDGQISKEDLKHVLSCMVGMNIPEQQLKSIVRRVMKESDIDQDNKISFEEFKTALEEIDLDEKMSIRFLHT